MAVVGEAHIIVRAITDQVRDDIRRGFDGQDRIFDQAGSRGGSRFSNAFGRAVGPGGGSGMFSGLQASALQAKASFDQLVTTGYMLGPAIAGIVSVIGAAAAGLFALGAQAAAAGPALLSLLNVFGALAQGMAVLKMAFSGIGAAIGAAGQQSGGAGGADRDNTKQIENATRRVQDARKALARTYQQNADRVEAAQERIEAAAKREADALNNITEAKEAEAEANNDLLKAQQGVNEAREEAIESIQQLRFELEDAVLSEQRAALGLEDARNELAKVSNLPPNNRQRREAELAFAEAELKLRRAKDRTSDTAKEVEEANAKGIEGSDQVVAANERVIDAEKRLSKAKDNVTKAEDAAKEATKDREKAERDLQKVLLENAARLDDASEALQRAQDDLADVKNGADSAGGGVNKFAEAMSKLSPAGQEFALFAIGVQEKFDEIKKAAQQEFFSIINDDIKELANNYLPMLEERIPKTAAVLGTAAEKIIGVFNLPDNQNRIDRILESNDKILGDFGGALANLTDSFIILLDNLRPLAEEFSDWILDLTDGWNKTLNAKDATGELADDFAYAGSVVKTLGRTFGSLFRTIGNIGAAAAGPGSGGEKLLKLLEHVAWRWEQFTGSEEGQARLETFFNNIVPAVSELGGLIGDIGREIFELTEYATTPQEGGPEGGPLGGFITSLRDVVGILGDMGPQLVDVLPTIGTGLESAAQAISNLTSSGALQNFFEALAGVAGFVEKITGSSIFQSIFSIVAPLFAISRALSLVFTFAKFLFMGAIVGNIVKFVGLFKTIFGWFMQIKATIQVIGLLFGVGSGPVLLFAGAVAGLVAAFVAMWRESEIFRKAIMDLVNDVIGTVINVFFELKQKVEEALAPLGGTTGVVDKLKLAFKFLGDILGTVVVPIFEYGLKNAIEVIGAVIGTVVDLIGGFIATFKGIFDKLSEGDIGGAFKELLYGIFIRPFDTLLTNLFDLINDILGNVVDLFKDWFGDGLVSDIVSGITGVISGILGVFSDAWNGVVNWIKEFLGIASPSTLFAEIGQNILDGILNVVMFLPTKFLEFFTTAWTNITNFLTNTIGPALLEWPGKIAGWIKGLWDKFFGFLEDVWDDIVAFYGPDGKVATFLRKLPGKIKEWLTGMWDGAIEFLNDMYNKIVDFFGENSTLGKFIRGLKNTITGWAGGIWDGLTSGLSAALSGIKNTINLIGRGINMMINAANFLSPGTALDITPLPDPIFAARGGIFPAVRGGTLAVIGEGGRKERVEPLDENGLSRRDKAMIDYLTGGVAGGPTINVYPSEGMDERELAQMVSRELAFMMRRGSL